ncbi:UDP-glycosyltransferase UGT5-like [Galleria mellonella]|uniref:UDP-glucuronosyltransferase n=1 Tax=Galleria mellonella TaxID=7137 RepID=A0ABM3MUB9_GALME|nr:UDP-glycosyltransferase UGT5-like [Galleria mellonella]
MGLFFALVICAVLDLSVVRSARILAVFPSLFYSHHLFYRNYIDAFLDEGHEIVLVTPCSMYSKGEIPRNLTLIDVRNVSLNLWTEGSTKIIAESKNDVQMSRKILELIVQIIEKQLQTDEIKNLIGDKNKTFDLLLTEAFIKTTLIISHYFKIPVLEISSLGQLYGDFENIGAPVQPLLYPRPQRKRIYNLTIIEEISELYKDFQLSNIYRETLAGNSNEVLKNTPFGSTPSIDILQNNVHMLFLNSHPVWETNRPVPLSVLYAFGVHQKPYSKLPQDLLTYLESSVNGVVYVAFGTTANICQYSAKMQVLLNAFSQLPYDFLLKWPEDELPGKPENVKIAKWFPQADLLKHPKIKAFITQGGLQSTDEAIQAGVPLIGIPLIWDQWGNAEGYVRHGIGVKLEMEHITEEQLIEAVNAVVTDDSYRRNTARLRALLRDAPQRPLERALWWTRYLLRHGGASHLRAPAANMSYAEYFELELCLILFSVLFICSILLYCCLRFVYDKYVILLYKQCFVGLKSKFINVKYRYI